MAKYNFSGPGKRRIAACAVLLTAAVLFFLARGWAAPEPADNTPPAEYMEYDRGVVTQILADSTVSDPVADGGFRGEQLLLVEVTSGQYKGETLQVSNFVGPLYGDPLLVGDSAVLAISTYSDGSHFATVYEYDRLVPLAVLLGVFLVTAVLIGGKTGAKSLVGLALTLGCLFYILIPALFKGAPTLPTVFLVCAYIAVVTLTILGGVRRKTVCAAGGTVCGVALALIFAVVAQKLTRINGLRVEDVEPLLQLRQTGGVIGLRHLLTGGILISALGAVMDVTMGIASSVSEVHAANPSLTVKELFRSGMQVGRDMVGTMTNTLVLAFLGSSFTLILYLYSLNLQLHQLISSPFLSIEMICSLSSSIGVTLSIPLTALFSALAMGNRKKS